MIKTKDEMEKIVPSAEEEEEEEEKEEKEKEEDGEDSIDDGDKEAEVKTAAVDGKIQPAAKTKNKAQSDVLNLNNEVVKMRKEVKRVRALVIRKLTRQLAALKKKKGKETEIERNQRRAARLLEEIHAMKDLSPDLVTKTALQKNLNFEKVCKNPKSTISDRAIARIATHPQFSKKIEDIKAAVKAFKDERRKGGKPVEQKNEQKQAEKTTKQSANKQEEEKSESEEEERAATPQKVRDDEVGAGGNTDDAAVAKTEEETCSDAPAVVQPHKKVKSTSVKPAVVETCDLKDSEKDELESEAAEKQPSLEAAPTVVQEGKDDQETDVESSDDEEKEYFDDSTEERFHKQSSQSEESDDDDFFVGKVSKFKKKKKKDEGEEKREEGKKDSTDSGKSSDKLQKELDELESRLKSKASPFQSVFCSSLAPGKAGRGGTNGRGRGDRFRGQGRPQGGSAPNREFSQQARFQKQQKDSEGNSVSKYSKPCTEARHSESSGKGFEFAGRGRGRGRGRGDSFRQREFRGKGVFSHQAPQEALHPSWEASKKRKEQQGQILAFQGKKIKFDDDD